MLAIWLSLLVAGNARADDWPRKVQMSDIAALVMLNQKSVHLSLAPAPASEGGAYTFCRTLLADQASLLTEQVRHVKDLAYVARMATTPVDEDLDLTVLRDEMKVAFKSTAATRAMLALVTTSCSMSTEILAEAQEELAVVNEFGGELEGLALHVGPEHQNALHVP
jgi:hypothetical protein